ncbi:hypothetical protein [Variovorax sp. UC74_104]|uniref:hypothetical protein n=1 Tax=Variovorax sp. UC74_104 TaxID=3374555 RepID=UPI003757B2B5
MAKEIIASCEASPEGNGVAAKGSIFDPAGGRPIRQLEDDPRYAGYPFVIDQASPTLITLQLKPRAGEFPGYSEFLEVADQCGFRMPWLGPQMLGLISNDTRKLIAPFRSIGGGRWGKPIDQVVIQIDPEASLIEESAGQRLD